MTKLQFYKFFTILEQKILPNMKFLGIIPARYDSVRFPGKPLADLLGKPIIQHVYERARKVLPDIVIATDDRRIKEAVHDFGGNVVLTSPAHQSGSDRCAEAALKYPANGKSYDVIINIQGDEPFIQPEHLTSLISCFDDQATQIATLVNPVQSNEDIFNPNVVKVIMNSKKEAIYFSRSPIPYLQKEEKSKWSKQFCFYKHIGIYAFRNNVLQEITKLPVSPLEKAESLEQIRWLENNYIIRVEITQAETFGIDTPEDLDRARKIAPGYLTR